MAGGEFKQVRQARLYEAPLQGNRRNYILLIFTPVADGVLEPTEMQLSVSSIQVGWCLSTESAETRHSSQADVVYL